MSVLTGYDDELTIITSSKYGTSLDNDEQYIQKSDLMPIELYFEQESRIVYYRKLLFAAGVPKLER